MRLRLSLAAFLVASVIVTGGLRAADSANAALAATAGQEKPPPRLRVPEVKGVPPKIDGILDDELWRSSAEGSVTSLAFGEEAKGKTRFLVAHDTQNLYVAVESFEEPDSREQLTSKVTEHDGFGIWDDDCVEFFIDPTNRRQSYYQIIINAKGVTWDACHAGPGLVDMSWDPKYQSSSRYLDSRSWVTEFAFPLTAFDRTDSSAAEWAFNVAHMRLAAKEYAYWSPTLAATSHVPARFGTLTGMPERRLTPEVVMAEPKPPEPTEVTILDFEDPADAGKWTVHKLPEVRENQPETKVEVSEQHATSGKHSLKITFAGGEWPAVATTQLAFPDDLLKFSTIKLDVVVSRSCLVGMRLLQEGSKPGIGWSAGVTRWNKTGSLVPGKNTITGTIVGRGGWEAVSPDLGKITTLVITLYHPKEGESIFIDNFRLSREKVWPTLTRFKVLGTDLVVSGVEELNQKLNGQWKPPEFKTVEQVEQEFTRQFEDLKKTHPKAVLVTFRQGQNGFDPAHPDRVYEGWMDTHINAHSPDGPNEGRTAIYGGYGTVETFMRHRSQLIRVDVSTIPGGSKILAARLLIAGVDPREGPEKTEKEVPIEPNMWVAEACNRPWVGMEANGYCWAKDRFWNQTGGMSWEGDDPDFLPIFLAHGPSQGHISHWDFTEAVRFWTDGAHANHGFLLHGSGKPYMRAFTGECKDAKMRPALMVIYESR